jgi:hypothetical protein
LWLQLTEPALWLLMTVIVSVICVPKHADRYTTNYFNCENIIIDIIGVPTASGLSLIQKSWCENVIGLSLKNQWFIQTFHGEVMLDTDGHITSSRRIVTVPYPLSWWICCQASRICVFSIRSKSGRSWYYYQQVETRLSQHNCCGIGYNKSWVMHNLQNAIRYLTLNK